QQPGRGLVQQRIGHHRLGRHALRQLGHAGDEFPHRLLVGGSRRRRPGGLERVHAASSSAPMSLQCSKKRLSTKSETTAPYRVTVARALSSSPMKNSQRSASGIRLNSFSAKGRNGATISGTSVPRVSHKTPLPLSCEMVLNASNSSGKL